MHKQLWVLGFGVLILSGCGGYQPPNRAHDVVFDVSYIASQQKHSDLILGAKKLSIPEAGELFRRPEKLLEMYHVYYLRAHNAGDKSYFLHLINAQLPTRKDIEPFFDPHSAVSTIAKIILMIPLGIGLAAITQDAMISILSFLGMSAGSHVVENYVLGVAGYDKLAKYAVVTDPDRGTPGLAVLWPTGMSITLFMPRRDPNAQTLTISVSSKDMMTKEIRFDMNRTAVSM